MKTIELTSILLGIFLIVGVLSAFEVSEIKAASSVPAGSGTPPSGGDEPGGGEASPSDVPSVAQPELGNKYSLEILAPSGIPVKTIHIKDPKGEISINWDDPEHGPQVMTNACFNGEILMFDALSGTPGDELFHFTLKIYPGGILLGHMFRDGGPQSPVVLKAVE